MRSSEAFAGNALVTGGTSGLGLELVKVLLAKGWRVVTTGRQKSTFGKFPDQYQHRMVDFSNLEKLSAVAREIASEHTFDLIVNNAGILSPPCYTETENGLEYTFQVNFLAHLLLDEVIINSGKGDRIRIISVISPVYRMAAISGDTILRREAYSPVKAYPASKLYLAMLHDILKRRHEMQGIGCISFDPGTFSSAIYRMQSRWFRNMYSIAAPFMRSPARVAEALGMLVQKEHILPGMIYNRSGRYKPVPDIPDHVMDSFTDTCYSMIDKWI